MVMAPLPGGVGGSTAQPGQSPDVEPGVFVTAGVKDQVVRQRLGGCGKGGKARIVRTVWRTAGRGARGGAAGMGLLHGGWLLSLEGVKGSREWSQFMLPGSVGHRTCHEQDRLG